MEKQRDRDDIRAIMLTTVEGKECLCVCWKERERKKDRERGEVKMYGRSNLGKIMSDTQIVVVKVFLNILTCPRAVIKCKEGMLVWNRDEG